MEFVLVLLILPLIMVYPTAADGITDANFPGVSFLVDGCRHIEYLDLSKFNMIGDVGISKVVKGCTSSPMTLKLLGCSNISDKTIIYLASSCKKLVTLVIGECCKVSDESLSYVLANCRNFRALDIGFCKLTDSAIHGLGKGGLASNLDILKANNCLERDSRGSPKCVHHSLPQQRGPSTCVHTSQPQHMTTSVHVLNVGRALLSLSGKPPPLV